VYYQGWGKIKNVDKLMGAVTFYDYRSDIPKLPVGTFVMRSDHSNNKSFEFMDAEYNQWQTYGEGKANAGPYYMQHGNWRVEIEPIDKQKEDIFLHVLIPCDETTQAYKTEVLHKKVNATRNGHVVTLELHGAARTFKINYNEKSHDASISVVEHGKTVLVNELRLSSTANRNKQK
jgi:hypothetical protein